MSTTLTCKTISGNVTHEEGRIYLRCETMETEDLFGKTLWVRKLFNDEARAIISDEYGFEYGSIIITADCWYGATDWDYFRFRVKCREYEVKDFGDLKIYNGGAA